MIALAHSSADPAPRFNHTFITKIRHSLQRSCKPCVVECIPQASSIPRKHSILLRTTPSSYDYSAMQRGQLLHCVPQSWGLSAGTSAAAAVAAARGCGGVERSLAAVPQPAGSSSPPAAAAAGEAGVSGSSLPADRCGGSTQSAGHRLHSAGHPVSERRAFRAACELLDCLCSAAHEAAVQCAFCF